MICEGECETEKIICNASYKLFSDKMKKLKQAKAEAKTDLEKLTKDHEAKFKDTEVKILFYTILYFACLLQVDFFSGWEYFQKLVKLIITNVGLEF